MKNKNNNSLLSAITAKQFEDWLVGNSENIRAIQKDLHEILVSDGVLWQLLFESNNDQYTGLKKFLSDSRVESVDREQLVLFTKHVDNKVQELDDVLKLAFTTKDKIKWRCPSCGHFIEAFEKSKKKRLEKVLLNDIKVRICKKCRKKSGLFIHEGKLRILKVIEAEKSLQDTNE